MITAPASSEMGIFRRIVEAEQTAFFGGSGTGYFGVEFQSIRSRTHE